jgi:hypothetical protein
MFKVFDLVTFGAFEKKAKKQKDEKDMKANATMLS